jgi:pimeloyl-ACP methyl ester carboxylesterase
MMQAHQPADRSEVVEETLMDHIEPFRIDISDDELTDLQRRLRATRWPDPETPNDWSQGIPLAYVQEVCRYWAEAYDWRGTETRLNQLDQFRTQLDGLGIHLLHIRSPHDHALPLVMTHGWPGSIVEFLKVIGPLTDPTTHGGEAADAFHLVCPTLPGYGFSDKPTEPGWNIERIARAWSQLMRRLGYERYVAQGGDWGAAVTTSIGLQDTEHCLGIHLNMPIVTPDRDTMDDLTEREKDALAGRKYYVDWDSGYSKQQSTRPQTVGYGLTDSPAGQAAWILEKFWSWTDCDGHPENVLTRDELLDNIMMYWLPKAAASSARLYWESFGRASMEEVQIPVGCSIFPKEIFRSSRRWAEKRFRQLVYWNELDRGGHFAAFERPATFVNEVRACFRHMRGAAN